MSLSYIEPILETIAVPDATPVLSKLYDIKKFTTACFHVQYPVGFTATFRVLGAPTKTSTPADTGAFMSAASGSAGASMANLTGLGCAYVQLEITATVGTGSMTSYLGGKQ